MTAHGYIHVTNWDKFQHGHKGDLPWIKLYHKLLGDDEWLALKAEDKVLLVTIWMLASRYGNGRVVADQKWLCAQANVGWSPRSRHIERLNHAGFIEVLPTKSVALARARPEGEGSNEPKTETRAAPATAPDVAAQRAEDEPPGAPWASAPEGLAKLATVFNRGDIAA